MLCQVRKFSYQINVILILYNNFTFYKTCLSKRDRFFLIRHYILHYSNFTFFSLGIRLFKSKIYFVLRRVDKKISRIAAEIMEMQAIFLKMLTRYKRRIHPRRFSLNEGISSLISNLASKAQCPRKDRKRVFPYKLKAVCDLFSFAFIQI